MAYLGLRLSLSKDTLCLQSFTFLLNKGSKSNQKKNTNLRYTLSLLKSCGVSLAEMIYTNSLIT